MGAKAYDEFLCRKALISVPTGLTDVPELNGSLFPFQRDIVRWALRRGRAAIFADCGLGKTAMQLEWARVVCAATGGRVLILAPLAVAQQTVAEGAKFGIEVTYARSGEDAGPGITITNYEMLAHFDHHAFVGVVLDESSILKSQDGKTRTYIVESFRETPFRLACTATPAPNDHMELGNHSEFLGVMTRTEMLAMFFVHDGGETQKWRLKGHAEDAYWRWVCSWAVMMRKPSDLGYPDGAFILPLLSMHHHVVSLGVDGARARGLLFEIEAQTLDERRLARRSSIDARVARCAELVNASSEPWIVWCDFNAEGDALTRSIPDAVQVAGSDSIEEKADRMLGFAAGRHRVLVSKASICGFGMNFQVCPNVAFVGLSDSYEQFYQAIRRCWRFGQTRPVHCHVITSDAEGSIVSNIERKERDADRMATEMIRNMADINAASIRGLERDSAAYQPSVRMEVPSWLR